MYNLSNICKAANRLMKEGIGQSEAFKRSWAFAKAVVVKVVGVSFGKREKAIERLTRYNVSDITIELKHDGNNPFDENCVAVIASVRNKGSYCIGYLAAELAHIVAPIIKAGVNVSTDLQKIVGGWNGLKYGMRITVAI